MFFDFAPEQEPEIYLPANYYFIDVFPARHIHVQEKGIARSMPQERVIQRQVIGLVTHIGNLQRIFWPLIKTESEFACGITEFSGTAFYKPHGSKGHSFAALFILNNTSQHFRLGAHS